MKKAVISALLFFAFIFILTATYYLMLPNRSEQLLNKKVAGISDSLYHNDELTKFNTINDKKIAEELNSIHQSVLMSHSVIQTAILEFGANSTEAGNALAMKEYRDSINLLKVTAIINKYGWPCAERIGAQNNYTLYTTIQNADFHTQENFIPVMENAVNTGSLLPELFAKLIDRKSLAEHGLQIFGTHFSQEKHSGKIIFSPIIDEKLVNERRKKIGLKAIDLAAAEREIDFLKCVGI